MKKGLLICIEGLDASGKDPMDALLALGEEHSDIMTIK